MSSVRASRKKFRPKLASFTKSEIAGDVNNLFDMREEDDDALDGQSRELVRAVDITDAEAQAFVDRSYEWLQESLETDEDGAYDAEYQWMREWRDGHQQRLEAQRLV